MMNVADDRVFQPRTTTTSHSSNGNAFWLVYHGNMTGRYGLDLLIRAVDIVRQTVPGIRLILNGCSEEFMRRYSWSRVSAEYADLVDQLTCLASPESLC